MADMLVRAGAIRFRREHRRAADQNARYREVSTVRIDGRTTKENSFASSFFLRLACPDSGNFLVRAEYAFHVRSLQKLLDST